MSKKQRFTLRNLVFATVRCDEYADDEKIGTLIMAIWFDVEDLVRYFHYASRPTGIQRLSFEIYRELWRLEGESGQLRFCRRGFGASGFRSIHFPALEAGIQVSATAETGNAVAPAATASTPPPVPAPSFAARLAGIGRFVAPRYRYPLGEMFRGVMQIYGGMRNLIKVTTARFSVTAAQRVQIGGHQFDLEGDEVDFAPGDWLVNLGAPWETPYSPAFLAQMQARGVRLAVLMHDLIPELFPEWQVGVTRDNYRRWLREAVPAASVIFANSRTTASDTLRCQAALGNQVPAPVVLPVGCIPLENNEASEPPPSYGSYVLLVSTIEARKNHMLMFRVWRRLLQEWPESQVPSLFFAGKQGWLTADLMQQLQNTNWLDGKIRFFEAPSEAELSALYRNCLFTVFPSLYEGWGLPVTESLCFGKTVAASNRAAIPEAGGDFCAYYDPENLEDAFEVISGLIRQPERVATLEARIARDFSPPTWADTAHALLRTLRLALPAKTPAVALSAD